MAHRRNPAWLAPLVASVLPLVISGIGKVLGQGVGAFNALPREERRARLRQVLDSATLRASVNPVLLAAARKAASSPAAVDALLDVLERHGAGAVSAGTGAAQALASRKLAERSGVKTNGKGARRYLTAGKYEAVIEEGASRLFYLTVFEGSKNVANFGPATFSAIQKAWNNIAEKQAIPPRSNGRRKNHYHVGPAVAMVNRRPRRNGTKAPRAGDMVRVPQYHNYLGTIVAEGFPWKGASREAFLVRFGSGHEMWLDEKEFSVEFPARKNSMLHVAAGFAAGAVAEKKLGVVGRVTALLKNPANPSDPDGTRRDEYLSVVASAARAVVRERQRSAGTSYHGDNERSLETALGMAQGMGYGPEARALARAILKEAPATRLAPGTAWVRGKARAHRVATGDRDWPVRNPAEVHVLTTLATLVAAVEEYAFRTTLDPSSGTKGTGAESMRISRELIASGVAGKDVRHAIAVGWRKGKARAKRLLRDRKARGQAVRNPAMVHIAPRRAGDPWRTEVAAWDRGWGKTPDGKGWSRSDPWGYIFRAKGGYYAVFSSGKYAITAAGDTKFKTLDAAKRAFHAQKDTR